jgi:hypothetical protein
MKGRVRVKATATARKSTGANGVEKKGKNSNGSGGGSAKRDAVLARIAAILASVDAGVGGLGFNREAVDANLSVGEKGKRRKTGKLGRRELRKSRGLIRETLAQRRNPGLR